MRQKKKHKRVSKKCIQFGCVSENIFYANNLIRSEVTAKLWAKFMNTIYFVRTAEVAQMTRRSGFSVNNPQRGLQWAHGGETFFCSFYDCKR